MGPAKSYPADTDGTEPNNHIKKFTGGRKSGKIIPFKLDGVVEFHLPGIVQRSLK